MDEGERWTHLRGNCPTDTVRRLSESQHAAADVLVAARGSEQVSARMIAVQEELDWEVTSYTA